MIEEIRKFLKVQKITVSTSIYLFKQKKIINLISVASSFCVIIGPLTVMLISNNLKDTLLSETQPYSYLIFKSNTSDLEIKEFLKYTGELKDVEIKVIPPEEMKAKFYQSIGVEPYSTTLKFPHSAEILYPLQMGIEPFKDAHNYAKAHETIQSAESNQQFILAARLIEKSLLWFLYISFFITIVFCILVSYISSKSLLLSYSEEVKGLMLSGLGQNAIKQPLMLCGLVNGAMIAFLLCLTSAVLSTKSSSFINEYMIFEGSQSTVNGWYTSVPLVLIGFSLVSYVIGTRLVCRQISLKMLIE